MARPEARAALASSVAAVEPVEDPGPSLVGDPGPGVVDGQRRRRAPSAATRDRDPCRPRGVLAGVVEQDAEEPVEPFRRRGDRRRRRRGTSRGRSSAGGSRRSPRTGRPPGRAMHGEVDRLAYSERRFDGVEPGQPQQVLEHPPHPLRLVVDPAERRAVPGRRRARGRGRGSVWASMTASGVRSSCEASAVNSSWRRRDASIGAATRRPIATAPRKTIPSRSGAITSSARMTVAARLGDGARATGR